MDKFPIGYILLGNFIRYDIMSTLTLTAFHDSDADAVNVYIDMYQMLLGIYKNGEIDHPYIITSSMINLCAHIRSYYRTRHNVETKIFIVYSNNASNSAVQFCPDYNKNYRDRISVNKKMDDMVDTNISLLKILCPYIPGVYFVTGTFEPGVIIYDLICKEKMNGNPNPSIVFSKSVYNYQIPANMADAVVFRNKRSGDARVIMQRNVLEEYIMHTRTQRSSNATYIDNLHLLSGELLSLIMALTNLPSRCIPSLFNIRTAMNMLIEAINSRMILNGYNTDIDYVYTILNSIRPIPLNPMSFSDRFKSIDLRYQLMLYMQYSESKDTSYLLDLYDVDTVQAINNEYFKLCPLDLNRL